MPRHLAFMQTVRYSDDMSRIAALSYYYPDEVGTS
jgi:hypothetical protein